MGKFIHEVLEKFLRRGLVKRVSRGKMWRGDSYRMTPKGKKVSTAIWALLGELSARRRDRGGKKWGERVAQVIRAANWYRPAGLGVAGFLGAREVWTKSAPLSQFRGPAHPDRLAVATLCRGA